MRLAVLSPALGIVIRDIGAADLVVARHGWDLALDASIPVGGDQSGLDYESLLRARPTHVLLEWPGAPPERLMRLAEQRGWTVLDYETLSLDDMMRAADDLHAQFAPEPKGPAPSARLREAIGSARPHEGAGRVLLIVPGSVPAALGPGSFHHEILVRLGATPAITEGGPWITLDGEDAMEIAPDSIVIIDPRPRGVAPGPAPTWDALAARLGRMATLPIPAIESRRVALMAEPEDLTPSTAMIDWARRLRGILEAWDRDEGGQ
ncbi:MAG: ABC transporter substrate-binding protein [Phycisphaerales bacterium JB039]